MYAILKDKKVIKVDNVIEWGKWYEANTNSRILDKTQVGKDTVSTVFMGLDHGFTKGKSLWFESMVFPDCEIVEQYETWEEARIGHDKIVTELRKHKGE